MRHFFWESLHLHEHVRTPRITRNSSLIFSCWVLHTYQSTTVRAYQLVGIEYMYVLVTYHITDIPTRTSKTKNTPKRFDHLAILFSLSQNLSKGRYSKSTKKQTKTLGKDGRFTCIGPVAVGAGCCYIFNVNGYI